MEHTTNLSDSQMKEHINNSIKAQIEIKEKERVKMEKKNKVSTNNQVRTAPKNDAMEIDRSYSSKLTFTEAVLFNEKNHQIPKAFNTHDIKCSFFNDLEIEEYSVMYIKLINA